MTDQSMQRPTYAAVRDYGLPYVRRLYEATTMMGTSGGRICATALASLYNGNRVKFDLSDVRALDRDLFESLMGTLRLCYELNEEPHRFFEKGSERFENMIAAWGLEKRRRGAR